MMHTKKLATHFFLKTCRQFLFKSGYKKLKSANKKLKSAHKKLKSAYKILKSAYKKLKSGYKNHTFCYNGGPQAVTS